MKAAVHRRFGAPDVITVQEVARPAPQAGEVLIRVGAATVGVVDGLARRGSPFYARVQFGLRRPRFPVLGSDFAGQVARHYGARVTAVCGGAGAELVRRLGAAEVVDYTPPAAGQGVMSGHRPIPAG